MEYTINKLAKMAGISTRTLRYYDECALLSPRRINSNGYRLYGQPEIDRLQQILFYRELGFGLSEIGQILSAVDFSPLTALRSHLTALQEKRDRISILIQNVEKSIQSMEGEIIMNNTEKFEGFKQCLIDNNERQYGGEIRERFGNDTIDRSNANLKGLTQEQYEAYERLTQELNETLKAAFTQSDPASPLAQRACQLHKEWLCVFWPEGMYSKEAHLGLAQSYVDDERFKAYYDNIAPGLAMFLLDAVWIFCR